MKLKFRLFPPGPSGIGYQLDYVIPYNLSDEEHTEFQWRAHYFLATTEIEFRQFEKYDGYIFHRVRFLIASVVAQMTFRLPDKCFSIYSRVVIYPDYYYSRVSKQYHKGETNPGAGLIVFSLRGISEGFALPYDGINLIYHELAHAIYLEHRGMKYNLFDETVFDEFERHARVVIGTQQPEDYFLRTYALTSTAEFFAVAVENFFERSAGFKQALPELYDILVRLMRQDPLLLK